jgi:hypothetical protein
VLAHLFGVLLDQFFDMSQHQDAGFRPLLQRILTLSGDDVLFAAASR